MAVALTTSYLNPATGSATTPPPDDGTADIVFTGSTRTNPSLNWNFQLQSITFNSSASPFTISQTGGVGIKFEIGTGGISQDDGSTQTLNTEITLAATQIWHADAGTLSIGSSGTTRSVNMNGRTVSLLTDSFRTINLHSRIYGSGNLTKSGLGFMNLYNGSNSWSGTMTLNGGIVRLQADNALSASSALNINSTGRFDLNGYDTTALWLGGSGQIDLDGGELTVGDSSNRSYNGVIEGTGGRLIKEGSGTLTLTNTQITDGTEYWVKAGSLVVQDSLGTSPELRINPGATIDLGTSTLNASQLIGAGTLDMNGYDLYLTVGSGEVSLSNGTLLGTANADLYKLGDGKLILGQADTYTGQIRVNDGRLGFSEDNLFDENAPLGDIIIQSTGRLELDGTEQSFRLISGAGVIDLDGGELRLLGFDHPTDTKYYGLNIEGDGDLILAPDNTTTGWYNPDIDISSSSLNFNGKIIVEDGFVTGIGRAYDDVETNELEIGGNGQVIVQNPLRVKTITGAGTLVSRFSDTIELIGDGGNYSYTGQWTSPPDATPLRTMEIQNQTWTFDGDIARGSDRPPTQMIVHDGAYVNLKTKSNGDISIPDQVEAGGNASFALNSTSKAWTLSGPSGVNSVSGTAGISATNGALATVSLQPSFNNILLTTTSNGGRIRLIQDNGTSNAKLIGSGEVELGGDLTLKSLSGTMDIDLRGHILFLDINSFRIFEGRFIDSLGGGSIFLYGTDELQLGGLSTYGGLLNIGTAGSSDAPGKISIDALNNALSNDTSIHLEYENSELDLKDNHLEISSLTGAGRVSGLSDAYLRVRNTDFSGSFVGSTDAFLNSSSSFADKHKLTDVTGTLGSLEISTGSLQINTSQIDVTNDIYVSYYHNSNLPNLMEINDSTLRSIQGRVEIKLTDANPDSVALEEALQIARSTIETEDFKIFNEVTDISIQDSSLIVDNIEDNARGNIRITSQNAISISNTTLQSNGIQGHTKGTISALSLEPLLVTGTTLVTDGELLLQSNLFGPSDYDGNVLFSNTTANSTKLYAGASSQQRFSWNGSSLSTTESRLEGQWTIEASDLDFGTLTAQAGASANFISGSITIGNDISLGNGQFLGNQLTLSGQHELNVGGTFDIEKFALLTLDRGDLTVGDMAVNGDFDWIAGDLTIDGSLSIGFSSFLSNDAALGTDQTLHVNSGLTLLYGSSVTLDGGTMLTRGSGNSLTNNGTLSQLRGPIRTDAFSNNYGATTFVGSLFTVENLAMQLASVTNDGTLEMTGPGSILQLQNGGKLSNAGLISGTGVIDGSIENTSSFSPGRIRAYLGESTRITGNLDNDGVVELVGGSIEIQGSMINTGDITSRGLLAGNRSYPIAIENQGSMTFSGGTSDVYGNVLNSSSGTIISTGSGVVTFHDNLVNNGTEMRTSEGSSSVFLGDVSGSGAFNGTGTVYFEESFNPGNSPGLVTATADLVMGPSLTSTFEIGGYTQGTEYDFVDAEGELTLDGIFNIVLYNDFAPEAGDSFDLFDAPSISGSFDEVITDELPEGLEWNLSQLETDGIVSVQSTTINLYAVWTSHWGLLGADADLTADPNGDGTSNLEHFAFDTSPLGSGGTEGRRRVVIADDGEQSYLTYTFPVLAGATFDTTPAALIGDINYSVNGDDNLEGQDLSVVERSTLSFGMPALRDIDGDTFADWEYRSFRLTQPVSTQTQGFIQITVETAP
ncbi:MAG: beta strand repeat-containing protein [Opitutaceae bacterium]